MQAGVTERALERFCRKFVANPYMCYTEHGLHARFLQQLYDAFLINGLPVEDDFQGNRLSLLQKEYPTNRHFDRSRRQNWDVAVIRQPIEPTTQIHPYDHLPLAAVVEFGLNYGGSHLLSDLFRVSHRDAQVDAPMIAHLYRLSTAGARISKRDLSPNSAAILTVDEVCGLVATYPTVTVYYGVADVSPAGGNQLWRIAAGVAERFA